MKKHLTILFFVVLAVGDTWSQIDPGQFVDPFTGQFTYSTPVVVVPGPAGSGITVNLSYTSGVRPEDEASWVGYGWSLDLPVISREKRGLPDDYYDAPISFRHKVPDHTLLLIRPWAYLELFKFDKKDGMGPAANLTISYDSEFGLDISLGASLRGSYGGFSSTFAAEHGGDFRFGFSYQHSHSFTSESGPGVQGSVGIGDLLNVRRAPALMSAHNATIYTNGYNTQITAKFGSLESPTEEYGFNVMHFKTSVGNITRRAYGYLYHENILSQSPSQMPMLDYTTERQLAGEAMEAPFSPIPISAPDQFHVRGAGISGVFRAYSRLPFDCSPPTNRMELPAEITLHAELHPDLSIGSAVNVYSRRELVTGPAPIGFSGSRNEHVAEAATTMLRPFVFRYTDDPSDEMSTTADSRPVVGSAQVGVSRFDFFPLKRDQPVRANISVRPLFGSTKVLKASAAHPNSLLTGFEVTSASGTTFLFDQPVAVTKERVIAHTLRHKPNLRRAGKRVVLSEDPNAHPEGLYTETHEQEITSPYASEFLPSAIFSPEYKDVTGNGLTNDDIGWTKFTYKTISSGFDVRSPFHGYWFNAGLLEDARDDNISALRLTREAVVVKKIETATHYAEFFTNADASTVIDRLDGYPAQDEFNAAKAAAVTGVNPQVMLTHIKLYKKIPAGPAKLVSTTYFAYDYSLAPGNPSTKPEGASTGKLTLRKVWTEPFEVRSSDIAPLEFHYQYPEFTTTGTTSAATVVVGSLASKYPELQSASLNPPLAKQNPPFDANTIDAWGFTGAIGTPSPLTAFLGQPPLPLPYDNRPNAPSNNDGLFEAPYVLKRVTMPSGAQLVIQYDRADYSSLQDSNAMELRRVVGTNPSTYHPAGATDRVFGIDYSDLSAPERALMVKELQRRFVDNQEPMFADMMYQVALAKCCPRDYDQSLMNIPTYLRVTNVAEVGGGVIQFTVGTGGAAFSADFGNLLNNCRQLPFAPALTAYRHAIRRHYRQDLPRNVADAAWEILQMLWNTATPPLSSDNDDLAHREFPTLMPSASRLRLPLLTSKITNIPRVRSIAFVSPDGALQEGDARVVGRRFSYNEFGRLGVRSSGVATSEPLPLRNEMGILQARADLHQDTRDGQAFRPIDMQRFEMPLAEGLLGASTIGYARVTSASWHDGVTNSGTTVYKFLTAREVPPVRIEYTRRERRHSKYPDILNVLVNISSEDITCKQGYSINIRRGHGLPLAVEHYSGRPSSAASWLSSQTGTDAAMKLLSYTRYHYDPPEAPAFILDTVSRPFSIGHPGATSELTIENRRESSADIVTQLQASVRFLPPMLAVSPEIRNHQRSFVSHVATKLSVWPMRLRAVTHSSDGVSDSMHIVAYDRATGSPAIVQTFDGYHGLKLGTRVNEHTGSITTISQKACDFYPEMGSRQEAESMVFRLAGTPLKQTGWFTDSKINAPHGSLGLGTVSIVQTSSRLRIAKAPLSTAQRSIFVNTVVRLFSKGDKIEVRSATETFAGVVTSVSQSTTSLAMIELDVTWQTLAPPIGSLQQLRIVRSGRSNQTAAPLGSTWLYGLSFDEAINYATKLHQRRTIADQLTDWVRNGLGVYGYAWSRPLARFVSGTSVIDEDAIASSLIYPLSPSNILSGCPFTVGPVSKFELRVEPTGWSTSFPLQRSVVLRYTNRDPLTCAISDVDDPNYKCTLTGWENWTRFRAADDGDLVFGTLVDPVTAVRDGSSPLIFGFRGETMTGTTPTGWNASTKKLTAPPAGIGCIPASAFEQTLGASGVVYAPFQRTANIWTWRPVTSYQAFQKDEALLTDGWAPEAGTATYPGSFSGAGTFTTAGMWQPTSTPAATWRKMGNIESWNDYGLVEAVIDENDIPTTMKYKSNGYLLESVVVGALSSNVFVDDGESGGLSTSTHSGKRAHALPHTFSVGLGAISDPRVLALSTSSVARFWIIGECDADNLTVSFSPGPSLSGTSLEAYRVSSQEGMHLYEVPITGSCSTATVSSTASGCSVDDFLVRPMESSAATFIYDDYDRVVGTIGDDGYLQRVAFDPLGLNTRYFRESIRGNDMSADVSLVAFSRRRTIEEIAGGVHSAVGPQPMLMKNILDGVFPWNDGNYPSLLGKPGGVRASGELLRFNASPDARTLEVFPDVNGSEPKP